MDDQQQSGWRPTRRQLLWAASIVGVVALLLLIRLGYAYRWTGFGYYKVNGEVQPFKTLWDWLQLLIVPIVLALGGYFFARSESRRTQDIADQQRALEREIVEQRRQDDTLQAYLDQMGQLLLDKDRSLRQSKEGDEVRTLARARTLTVLSRLADGSRKGTVVRFLYEAGLLSKADAVVDLRGADLRGASLSRADLEGAVLSGTNLSEANLSGTALYGAELSTADLSNAVLERAGLTGAGLEAADLSGANLSHTSMENAFLKAANLTGTVLSGAYLTGATLNIRTSFPTVTGKGLEGVPPEEIPPGEWQRRADALASLGREEVQNQELDYVAKDLKGATMPTGQKYEDWLKNKNEDWLKPDYVPEKLKGVTMPNGQKYEEWLKSKDRGEDGANKGS